MGSGGSKAHEYFSLATASVTADSKAVDVASTEPFGAESLMHSPETLAALALNDVAALAKANAALDQGNKAVTDAVEAMTKTPLSADLDDQGLLDNYAAIDTAVQHAVTQMEQMKADGLISDEQYRMMRQDLSEKFREQFDALSADQQQLIGLQAGMTNPHLVSGKALAFYADPAYQSADAVSRKEKIDAASCKYAAEAIANGGDKYGKTPAELDAQLAALKQRHHTVTGATSDGQEWAKTVHPSATYDGDPHAIRQQMLNDLGPVTKSWDQTPDTVAGTIDQIAARQQFINATAADHGNSALQHQHSVQHFHLAENEAMQLRSQVYGVLCNPNPDVRDAALTQMSERFGIPADQLAHMNPDQVVAHLRNDSSVNLDKIAASRAAHEQQAAKHAELKALVDAHGGPIILTDANAADYVKQMQLTNELVSLKQQTAQTSAGMTTNRAVSDLNVPTGSSAVHASLTADKPSMSALRAAATDMGLENADAATRHHLTNYLAQSGNDNGSAHYQQLVSKAKAKKAQAAANKQDMAMASITAAHGAPAPAANNASSGGAATASNHPGIDVPTGGWESYGKKLKPAAGIAPIDSPKMSNAQAQALFVDQTQHYLASTSAIPAQKNPTELAAMSFTPAPAVSIGGSHSKEFHTGSDGTTYFSKAFPSDSNSECRVQAEAAASTILSSAGIPVPPAYAHTVNGKRAVVQPLLPGTKALTADVSKLSQADVDTIARAHVGAWAVGNHDTHAGNFIRTKNGGLIPVDHGQAFRHFGSDKLAADYHPNRKYSEKPPLLYEIMRAERDGKLAPGVRVRPEALEPVLQRFEAISDEQYASMLAPMVKAGAKDSGVKWSKWARTRVNKTNPDAVSADDTAKEFITAATARKRALRKDFMKLLVTNGYTSAASILRKGSAA